MAYENGTANSPHDLLNKVRIFCLANGWTINRHDTAPVDDVNRNELCVSKDDAYFNMASYENSSLAIVNTATAPFNNDYSGISINGSDGYSAADDWDRQTGYPQDNLVSALTDQRVTLIYGTGPFLNYYIFSPNSDCVFVEVEIKANEFMRFGFGKLNVYSTPTHNGRFFYGFTGVAFDNGNSSGTQDINNSSEMVPFRRADYQTSQSQQSGIASYVRCAQGSFDGWAQTGRKQNDSRTGRSAQGGVHEILIRELSKDPLNLQTIMTPIIVSLNVSDQFLMPIGEIPGMRLMLMNRYQPAEEFTFGPDNWKVYPYYRKGSTTGERAITYLRN